MSAASDGAQGIWKASLGDEEIVMAVNQSDQSLFGLAKSEGVNPWNGAVAGSISANAVSFSLAAFEGGVMASIYISATLEGDRMSGFFIRSDSNGKAGRGDFSATMIRPDTSGYTPVAVMDVLSPAAQTEPASMEQKVVSPAGEENETQENEKAGVVSDSDDRFKDVTKLAKGINPDILPRMAPL